MEHHEEAICLAVTPNGFVKICPPGCTHVTFSGLTCNFDSPSQFQEMAIALPIAIAGLQPYQNLRLEHNGIILEMGEADAHEFATLVADAAAAIAWSSGEMEFTDDDFREILRRLSP